MHVIIYTPAKGVTQSGRGRTQNVVMECDDLGARLPEPLMGWVSSPDTRNQVRLKFPDVQTAEEYAKGQGWSYTVQIPQQRRIKPRNYTDNFKYIPADDKKSV